MSTSTRQGYYVDTGIDHILSVPHLPPDAGELIGESRQGRAIRGFRFGNCPFRVSLIGGCHADEPVGPRFLRHLVAYLSTRSNDDPAVRDVEWWIVPHVNPDGEARNRAWYGEDDAEYDVGRYLGGVVREEPGDDIEFGFPRSGSDAEARPENRAVASWWHTSQGPFGLHVTLHGMGFAAGPWFLVEGSWRDRIDSLRRRCVEMVERMGYDLHDVERGGEKGFTRLGPGFSTRPDSGAMREFFLSRGDPDTADRFRPSSMEAIRALGGDPLTLVSEMPLFITPGVGKVLGPPDPEAERWKARVGDWREVAGDHAGRVRREARAEGLRPMAVRDQMALQWEMIQAGIDQVGEVIGGSTVNL